MIPGQENDIFDSIMLMFETSVTSVVQPVSVFFSNLLVHLLYIVLFLKTRHIRRLLQQPFDIHSCTRAIFSCLDCQIYFFRFLQLVIAHPAFSKDEDLQKFLKDENVSNNYNDLKFHVKTAS